MRPKLHKIQEQKYEERRKRKLENKEAGESGIPTRWSLARVIGNPLLELL